MSYAATPNERRRDAGHISGRSPSMYAARATGHGRPKLVSGNPGDASLTLKRVVCSGVLTIVSSSDHTSPQLSQAQGHAKSHRDVSGVSRMRACACDRGE
jgi:hypothetical protein